MFVFKITCKEICEEEIFRASKKIKLNSNETEDNILDDFDDDDDDSDADPNYNHIQDEDVMKNILSIVNNLGP